MKTVLRGNAVKVLQQRYLKKNEQGKTISIIADTSTSIEPLFALAYQRLHVPDEDGLALLILYQLFNRTRLIY